MSLAVKVRYSNTKVTPESQEIESTTPTGSRSYKMKSAYDFCKKSFLKLGCKAIRTRRELMVHRVQFIRRTKKQLLRHHHIMR